MITWKIIQDFLVWLEILKNSSKYTTRNYALYLRRFLTFLDNKEPTLYLIHDFRVHLYNLNYSTNYVNLHIAAIRSLLKYMFKHDLPTLHYSKVDVGKKEFKMPTYLERGELQKMFDIRIPNKLLDARNCAILRLLYSTGVRLAELLRMDIDAYRYPEMMIVGKGRKPRVIFISQDAHVAVTKYLKLRKEVKGPLFVSHGRNRDKRLSTVSIESIVRNYAIKAGITKKVTPHAIRHTFATELRKKGVDITFIKDFLGHSSILTTTIYLHVSNQELKNIHNQFLR